MKIGIVVVATNSYFVLAIRFIKNFMHFYEGSSDIVFNIFSDTNPTEYLPDNINIKYYHTIHNTWRDATNSKYSSILSMDKSSIDYIYYFDADTNVTSYFDESWFLGDIVAGQHYDDKARMLEVKAFDRNVKSSAYVPLDTKLEQMYFYGAFWGGETNKIFDFCSKMVSCQVHDKMIKYEPVWNDESYLNAYFHFNPPTKIVYNEDFKFIISDKANLDTRKNVNVSEIKQILKSTKYIMPCNL